MAETLWTLLFGFVMLVGVAGVFVPLIPDLLLIWSAGLAYGLLVEWGQWGPWLFGAMTLIGLLGLVAEFWVSGAGARLGGASWKAVLAGLALGMVGFVLLTPLGGLALLLLGTFAVEWLQVRDARKALRSMLGIGLGYGAGILVKLFFALAMFGLWLAWVFLP